jgi:hypothetical protein
VKVKVKLVAGQAADVSKLKNHPIIAVDLGFSKNNPSCGVAWRGDDSDLKPNPTCLHFGESIRQVASMLSKAGTTATLIIEAPLSYRFVDDKGTSKEGNPQGRQEFEKAGVYQGVNVGHHYWHEGAGAVIGLAAVFFLRRLLVELRKYPVRDDFTIHLFEGYLPSNAHGLRFPGCRDERNAQDAKDLLEAPGRRVGRPNCQGLGPKFPPWRGRGRYPCRGVPALQGSSAEPIGTHPGVTGSTSCSSTTSVLFAQQKCN